MTSSAGEIFSPDDRADANRTGIGIGREPAYHASYGSLTSSASYRCSGMVLGLPMSGILRMRDAAYTGLDIVEAFRRHVEAESVDLIITEPPQDISGDWIFEAERALRRGGQMYLVCSSSMLFTALQALRQTSLREVNHLIWKYNFGVHTNTRFLPSHDHVLYYAKPGGFRTFNPACRAESEETILSDMQNRGDREDVWVINRDHRRRAKSAASDLPLPLVKKMIAYSSEDDDLICDPFMGGCSGAAVAIQMNRRFQGFEVQSN
jgi:site-specific DNA-methyltransferase (adenine-specific)